ncbi:STAS domain-containing protein [Streptomyces longisporoflavus]|uniref:Anti-sigma factor antagonist n=1 Tax=Streptomyces longisporoflavus TaxID=28044 RepID=A0ABW7QII1_9ACTN
MPPHATLPPTAWTCPGCGHTFPQIRTPASVGLRIDADGERLVVTVSGELDLDSAPLLRQTLHDALEHAPAGIDLDLGGVDFCDCSVLNVLLHARHRAHRAAQKLVLRAGSPAVERLLELTGTRPLFTAAESGDGTTAEDVQVSRKP